MDVPLTESKLIKGIKYIITFSCLLKGFKCSKCSHSKVLISRDCLNFIYGFQNIHLLKHFSFHSVILLNECFNKLCKFLFNHFYNDYRHQKWSKCKIPILTHFYLMRMLLVFVFTSWLQGLYHIQISKAYASDKNV